MNNNNLGLALVAILFSGCSASDLEMWGDALNDPNYQHTQPTDEYSFKPFYVDKDGDITTFDHLPSQPMPRASDVALPGVPH